MRFIIVTGMSGAGKSAVVEALEDVGLYCVDNIPPSLIPKFAHLGLNGQDPSDNDRGRQQGSVDDHVRPLFDLAQQLPLLIDCPRQ